MDQRRAKHSFHPKNRSKRLIRAIEYRVITRSQEFLEFKSETLAQIAERLRHFNAVQLMGKIAPQVLGCRSLGVAITRNYDSSLQVVVCRVFREVWLDERLSPVRGIPIHEYRFRGSIRHVTSDVDAKRMGTNYSHDHELFPLKRRVGIEAHLKSVLCVEEVYLNDLWDFDAANNEWASGRG